MPAIDAALGDAVHYFDVAEEQGVVLNVFEWKTGDEICVAIALNSWKLTLVTRLTGQQCTLGGQGFSFLTTNWILPDRRQIVSEISLHHSESRRLSVILPRNNYPPVSSANV